MVDFVTHYYLVDRAPFRNLSDLDQTACREVMAELSRQRAAGIQHRRFGRTYMQMRQMAEQRLRRLFVAAGGRPDRIAPHYFVLGTSPWFRGLARDMREVRLPLAGLPYDQTSFTYPDSFTAMDVAAEFGLPREPRPYHGRVFRLDEIAELIDRYRLPDAAADVSYDGYERRSQEKYIEIQLWSDNPARAHLLDDR